MTDQVLLLIPQAAVQQLVNYLVQRPFAEVAEMIQGLQALPQAKLAPKPRMAEDLMPTVAELATRMNPPVPEINARE